MIRGTTPTISFDLPLSPDELVEIEFTLAQNKVVVLTKHKADMTFDGNVGTVKLREDETLNLRECFPIQLQLRIRTPDDDVYATDVETYPLECLLGNEAICG